MIVERIGKQSAFVTKFPDSQKEKRAWMNC